MTFEVLSPEEVRWRYQRAVNKASMFYVLSDLTLSKPGELAEFLGIEKPPRPKKEWTVGKPFDRKKSIRPDPETVRKLWEQGLNDAQIAEKIGCTKSPVCRIRKEQGLDSKFRPAAFPEKEAMRLWELGLYDTQIARELGIASNTVNCWRHRKGLKSNYNPHNQGGQKECLA